jgi:hypothetical protein
MINEKDRGQLLRMAGNIAGGIMVHCNMYETETVAEVSAKLALETLKEVDRLIEKEKTE